MSNIQWDAHVYITNLFIETIPKDQRSDEVLASIGLERYGVFALLQLLLTKPIRQKISSLEEPERTQWKASFSDALTQGLTDQAIEVVATLNLQPMVRTMVIKLGQEDDHLALLQKGFETLSGLLYQAYGFKVTGCFSPVFNDFFRIGHAYRQVCKLQTYHYCIGVGQGAFTETFVMDERPSLIEYKYLHHIEKLLDDQDWPGVHDQVTTLAANLRDHPINDSKTAYICKEIFSMTIRSFFKESGARQEEIRRLNEGIIMFNDWFDDIDEVVMHYLAIISTASSDRLTGNIHPHIRKMLAMIHGHYKEAISLVEIADALGLSTAYLSRLFKAEMGGTNYKVYLTAYRINLAKGMLVETTKKVEEIREAVGYQSQSQFSRVFKRMEGMAPSQYRQLYRRL